MKTVALIPIKLKNARMPGKNIRPFYDGTPLMHFIQKVCLLSKNIDHTYVYCSDEQIIDYIVPGVTFLKRPQFLDEDTANANTIITQFMKEIDADIYINTHATSPFATVETFDCCIEKVASGEYDSAFCAENLKTFIWSQGKPLNFDPDNFPRTQDLPALYAENSIAYVFTKDTFMKYKRRVGNNPYIHEVGKIEAIDIDYPEDFEIANAVYKEVMKK